MNMMSIPIDYLALCSSRQVLNFEFLQYFIVFAQSQKLVNKKKFLMQTCVKLLVRLSQLWSRVVLHLSLTFYIFNFSPAMAEQNSSKLDRKQDFNILYEVFVFQAYRKTKMALPAFDWLRHFRLLCNHCMEFSETWQKQDLNVLNWFWR